MTSLRGHDSVRYSRTFYSPIKHHQNKRMNFDMREILLIHVITIWMNFSPRYIYCLYELMMKWLNKYTFPGYMFVQHKQWPFGIFLYKISCDDSGIFFKLVEGKDENAGIPSTIIPIETKLSLHFFPCQ